MSETMTDQEKSSALLRLMGQAVDCTCGKPGCTVGREIDSGRGWFVPTVKNLYDPANMALAWRVVSWLCKPSVAIVPNRDDWRFHAGLKFRVWFTKYDIEYITDETPQRAWLDKILELAIAAGMVTE